MLSEWALLLVVYHQNPLWGLVKSLYGTYWRMTKVELNGQWMNSNGMDQSRMSNDDSCCENGTTQMLTLACMSQWLEGIFQVSLSVFLYIRRQNNFNPALTFVYILHGYYLLNQFQSSPTLTTLWSWPWHCDLGDQFPGQPIFSCDVISGYVGKHL